MFVGSRSACDYTALRVSLCGLDPTVRYTVQFIDDVRQKLTKTMTGRELNSELELRLPQRGSSVLARYERACEKP